MNAVIFYKTDNKNKTRTAATVQMSFYVKQCIQDMENIKQKTTTTKQPTTYLRRCEVPRTRPGVQQFTVMEVSANEPRQSVNQTQSRIEGCMAMANNRRERQYAIHI